MSELTRIITMRVTMISKDANEGDKEKAGEYAAKIVKESLGADDVNVLDVQDFLIGEENGKD